MFAGFRGFVENRGQWQTEAQFVADFDGLVVRAEPGAIVLQRSVEMAGRPRIGVVRFAFEDDESAQPLSGERAPGEFHYFYGNDPSRWQRHVPAYRELTYPGVSSGADVTLYQRDGHLEYDVVFPPAVDCESFAVRCEGVSGIAIEANGDLRLDTPLGPIVQSAPVARQVTLDGQFLPATCCFRILDSGHFGFTAPDRVSGARLVVDPGLTWATFVGGSAGDGAGRIKVRSDGRLEIAGATTSRDYPTTAGVFEPNYPGATDAVVTCLEPTGNALVFSTYLGGSAGDLPDAMALAADDSIAVVGFTISTDYPTLANAYDQSFNGIQDAFVSVLNPDGSDLVLSTLMGGSCGDSFNGVAFSSSGLIVAAGATCSPDFPVTPGAFDTSTSAPGDGVVVWLDPAQSGSAQLVVGTFLGATGGEPIHGLVMGPGDEPIVVGTTQMPEGQMSDFPTTPGAYDETPGGNFVSRLSADGSALVASTHFKEGAPRQVVVDNQTILIAGNPGLNLPVSPNAYDSTWNGTDCFVARFDLQLSRLLGATYLGGSKRETPLGIAVDPSGAILVVGDTDSDDYPTTLGAYDTVKGGPSGSITSMVSMLSPDMSQLLYSSFLGPAGPQTSYANDIASLGPADVVISGGGALPGFPVTPGAYDETFNGGTLGTGDGYVARMLLEPLTWSSLGGALQGSNGLPTLTGTGDLVGGQTMSLSLVNAKPVTPTTLIAGLSVLDAPFKGGTLVPSPNFLIFGLPTNAHGTLTLSATWPMGLPAGFAFFMQCWIPDPVGPAGFAASNGLAGITP